MGVCCKIPKGYFVEKNVLNANLKDFVYTSIDKTQIWFDEFNYYAFKVSPPPQKHEFLILNKY